MQGKEQPPGVPSGSVVGVTPVSAWGTIGEAGDPTLSLLPAQPTELAPCLPFVGGKLIPGRSSNDFGDRANREQQFESPIP